MARHEWTVDDLAARFAEAAKTARRLPRVGVQGYFNVWPAIIRQQWETLSNEEPEMRPIPPSPEAIERMMQTMRWVQWLEVDDRHLVWMRAKDVPWNRIARRFGCNRVTAWRRWTKALQIVADKVTASTAGVVVMRSEQMSHAE